MRSGVGGDSATKDSGDQLAYEWERRENTGSG